MPGVSMNSDGSGWLEGIGRGRYNNTVVSMFSS